MKRVLAVVLLGVVIMTGMSFSVNAMEASKKVYGPEEYHGQEILPNKVYGPEEYHGQKLYDFNSNK